MVVLGMSGGMDSATLLALLIKQNWKQIHCCTFDYGSTHNKYENQASAKIIEHYIRQGAPIQKHFIDLKQAMSDFSSNLLLACGQEIPEGRYQEESMKKTIVPGRNLIFAAIMAGLAESVGASAIALAVHSGDHAIYPDCRPEFIKALDSVIYLSSNRKVKVIAPFLNQDKADILRVGIRLQVPYNLTRSCYKNQDTSCGKCGTCIERLEAFQKIGIQDPIKYQGKE